MSVVDIETNEAEDREYKKGDWLCCNCHLALNTSMNIGFGKKDFCERCHSPGYVYMIN